MPRAKSKAELIKSATENYQKLLDMIDNMSEAEKSTEFDFSNDMKKTERHWSRDKNVRDIYIHLYEWHQMMLDFIKNNVEKKLNKQFLLEPYTWKTYGDMNIMLWEKHQNTSEKDARKMFEKSHADVLKLVDQFTDQELFEKSFYNWTGTTNLGSYFISVMPSHYDWAMKKLKAHKKNCEK